VRGTVPATNYRAGPGLSRDAHGLVGARRRLLEKYRGRLERRPEHLAHQYLLLAQALWRAGNATDAARAVLKGLNICPVDALESILPNRLRPAFRRRYAALPRPNPA
jgi:hypothetical protein